MHPTQVSWGMLSLANGQNLRIVLGAGSHGNPDCIVVTGKTKVFPNLIGTTTALQLKTVKMLGLLPLIFALWFSTAVNALHFYLDANEKRCFIEEIPTDTVVEGELEFAHPSRSWNPGN